MDMDSATVLKWGVYSRLCLFLLQMISNNLIPDHQGSMEDVFMRGYRHPPHHLFIEVALGGFDNWDSEHFIFIAEHGYGIHEQSMAFFPLFPSLLRILSQTLLRPFMVYFSLRSSLLVAAFALNLTLFPFAVLSLYLLTLKVFNNRSFSLLAAALFCINPASVFMSAGYTECLFSFLTFSGLLALEYRHSWPAALLFMFATATRSNGIVLCGYIGYQCLLSLYKITITTDLSITKSLYLVLNAVLQCLLIISPFVLFQYYGYNLYCKSNHQEPSPVWCSWTLPMSYSYIQENYWNNGFLRYFQLKQIPNFILAMPMIILSSCSIVRYFQAHKEAKVGIESSHMRPYVYCLTFLVLFGTFFMNVQVITRFICSASPLIYWFAAHILLTADKPFKLKKSTKTDIPGIYSVGRQLLQFIFSHPRLNSDKLIFGYFVLYVFLGFILHCNFYPWT